MSRKLSTAEKVRRMIDQGYTNKAIIQKLDIKPQVVYNIRYQINKARGLGAIGAHPIKPIEGIGTPPKKRKYTRRVKAGTGINQTPDETYNVTPLDHQSVREQFGSKTAEAAAQPIKRPLPGEWTELPITMIESKPTLWQRAKERMKNLARALGA